MPLNYKNNIIDGIRRLRKERRWTQVQLAKLLGLSQSRLSEVEKGKGSLTAEQFLLVLQTFNVPVSYFVPIQSGTASSLQNALARLGAPHLQEDTEILPSEKVEQVNDAIRETLLSAESSRQIASLAPVIVLHAKQIDLSGLRSRLHDLGFANRLGWLADNALRAVQFELKQVLPKEWTRRYRQAEVVLKSFILVQTLLKQESVADDILDDDIVSERTLEQVKESRSEISKDWRIVTRIQLQDFINALRSARESS